jgi:hypothetical protein
MLLPYERFQEAQLLTAVRLTDGESLLCLQPFGWHLNGSHLPNMAEHYSREYVCMELRLIVIEEYGPYLAVVRADRRNAERRVSR